MWGFLDPECSPDFAPIAIGPGARHPAAALEAFQAAVRVSRAFSHPIVLECKAILPYVDRQQLVDATMATLTVTAKGQVTLRKELLLHLGVQPGDKISIDKLADGRIELKAVRRTGQISDVFGFLKRDDGPSLSIEDMNRIAADG
jgi:bifunctional DNA-binding transcriptional regulator/antitoxin component of YhaV-PrlF toxin-antitoxin module